MKVFDYQQGLSAVTTVIVWHRTQTALSYSVGSLG